MELSRLDILLLIQALVWYGLAFVPPRLLRRVGAGYRNALLSQESQWVREKALRGTQRAFTYTFPVAVLLLWLVPSPFHASLLWFVPGLYSLGGYIYSRRLKREWQQWQLLGYDGPPGLADQEDTLTLARPRRTYLHANE